jgi:hypothetical protein
MLLIAFPKNYGKESGCKEKREERTFKNREREERRETREEKQKGLIF